MPYTFEAAGTIEVYVYGDTDDVFHSYSMDLKTEEYPHAIHLSVHLPAGVAAQPILGAGGIGGELSGGQAYAIWARLTHDVEWTLGGVIGGVAGATGLIVAKNLLILCEWDHAAPSTDGYTLITIDHTGALAGPGGALETDGEVLLVGVGV